MSPEGTAFPAYRRYANGRNFFKIINPRCFEEVQVFGDRRMIRLIEANQFPEMNLIADLLSGKIAETITEADYFQARDGSEKKG
jgi:hypothetical protein